MLSYCDLRPSSLIAPSKQLFNLTTDLGRTLNPYTAERRDVLGNTSRPRFPEGGDFSPQGPRDFPKTYAWGEHYTIHDIFQCTIQVFSWKIKIWFKKMPKCNIRQAAMTCYNLYSWKHQYRCKQMLREPFKC